MIFLLIVKHYICDIELQNNWQARGKCQKIGYFIPLTTHCLIHAVGTLAILYLLGLQNWWILAFFEVVAHYGIDLGKVRLNRILNASVDKKNFHRLYVADQCLHFAWYCLVCYIIGRY